MSQKITYKGNANALDLLEICGVDWNVWEEDLGDLDLTPLEDEITGPDYLSEHESDRDDPIEEMSTQLDYLTQDIKDSLRGMIQEAEDTECKPVIKQSFFAQPKNSIVTFSYTSTVELLYPTENVNILHIHGSYRDDDSLIFGYQQAGKSIVQRKQQYDQG